MKKYFAYVRQNYAIVLVTAIFPWILLMAGFRDASANTDSSWLDTAPWLTMAGVTLVSLAFASGIVRFVQTKILVTPEQYRDPCDRSFDH